MPNLVGDVSRGPGSAAWFRATAPPDESPVALLDLVPDPHRYLHVRATLVTIPDAAPEERVTPELLRIGVAWDCRSEPE